MTPPHPLADLGVSRPGRKLLRRIARCKNPPTVAELRSARGSIVDPLLAQLERSGLVERRPRAPNDEEVLVAPWARVFFAKAKKPAREVLACDLVHQNGYKAHAPLGNGLCEVPDPKTVTKAGEDDAEERRKKRLPLKAPPPRRRGRKAAPVESLILLGTDRQWPVDPGPGTCAACELHTEIIHRPEGGPVERFWVVKRRKLRVREVCLVCNRSWQDAPHRRSQVKSI
jgi:hypothetical protein